MGVKGAILLAGALGVVAGYLGSFALGHLASYVMRPSACRDCEHLKREQFAEEMGLYGLMAGGIR